MKQIYLTHLKKSEDFARGVECGFLAALLINVKPTRYKAKFLIENQEQIFMTIQQAGYAIGEWSETLDGSRFEVEMTPKEKRRARGRLGL